MLVFVLVAFGGRTGARVVVEFMALGLMLVGFVLGIVSLLGIRKHGAKNILAPALVGILINGLLLFIFITNFMAARAKARRHTSEWRSPIIALSSERQFGVASAMARPHKE